MSEEEFGKNELFSDAAEQATVSVPEDEAPGREAEAGVEAADDVVATTSDLPENDGGAPVAESAPDALDVPDDSGKEGAQELAEEKADGEETAETVRKRIRGLPGEWYVLHTYAGYEKRVKQDLETRIQTLNMEDYIFEVQVPEEQIYEVKKGQRKLVTRVRMPGYAIVRMNMTDDSWRAVQDTNGVTGFVGIGRNPVPLTEREVVQMLTPVVEQEAAEAAKAAGKPVTTGAPAFVADYEVGETVTLTTEPWVGMPATISQVDAANQRLTVLMTLVGQETPVDLSFSQVKKMD